MSKNKPHDGAPGTTDQWPRWEGDEGARPAGYMPAKDEGEYGTSAGADEDDGMADSSAQKARTRKTSTK